MSGFDIDYDAASWWHGVIGDASELDFVGVRFYGPEVVITCRRQGTGGTVWIRARRDIPETLSYAWHRRPGIAWITYRKSMIDALELS